MSLIELMRAKLVCLTFAAGLQARDSVSAITISLPGIGRIRQCHTSAGAEAYVAGAEVL